MMQHRNYWEWAYVSYWEWAKLIATSVSVSIATNYDDIDCMAVA